MLSTGPPALQTSGKNIGVDWPQISTQTGLLLGDTKFWIDNKTFGMPSARTVPDIARGCGVSWDFRPRIES